MLAARRLEHPLVQKYYSGLRGLYKEGFVVIESSGCRLNNEFMDDAQRILDFDVKEDDVWIITFPKCGTTWTQEMVWLLMNDLNYEAAKSKPLTERSPFLEQTSILPRSIRGNYADHTITKTENLSSPRIIKSHLPPELLPTKLWTVKPKIIYVSRNSKDVAISYYYHHKLWNECLLTLEEFCEAFLEDIPIYTPFWDHILKYWKMRHEPNILFNTFEEMKMDLSTVVTRTASFLGKSISESEIQQLVAHLSFSSMKKNPKVNLMDNVEEARRLFNLPSSGQEFIRRGEVGQAKSAMSPHMNKRFDAWIQRHLAGSDYPYA